MFVDLFSSAKKTTKCQFCFASESLVQSTKTRIGLASFQQRWKRHRAVVVVDDGLAPCILHLDCIELAYCYVLVMLDVTRLAWRSKKARLPTSSDIGLKFHSKRGTSRESGIMLTPPRGVPFLRQQKMNFAKYVFFVKVCFFGNCILS